MNSRSTFLNTSIFHFTLSTSIGDSCRISFYLVPIPINIHLLAILYGIIVARNVLFYEIIKELFQTIRALLPSMAIVFTIVFANARNTQPCSIYWLAKNIAVEKNELAVRRLMRSLGDAASCFSLNYLNMFLFLTYKVQENRCKYCF